MTEYTIYQETMLLWYVREVFIEWEMWTERDDQTMTSVNWSDLREK